MSEFSNKPVRGVQFDLVDLPPEGLDLDGEVPAVELDLSDEERTWFTAPVAYHLHLEPINGGNDLLVRGRLRTSLESVCDRCETVFGWNIDTDDVCHEVENAFGTTVDLSESLREDILMSFPQQFLCRDDCMGLCPRCGANLNDGACGCPDGFPGDDLENPWGALDGFDPSEK
ncbi:MAG: DUF177 domain-containing protein, partial [Lentisphaeria bacterium]|nr:DUF177 domain-containing protein [Lentisphaeria bacterium]